MLHGGSGMLLAAGDWIPGGGGLVALRNSFGDGLLWVRGCISRINSIISPWQATEVLK